ncbi:hypothetical protein C8J57DRAFT_1579878 [Mycena rebaudengoi]|nr:hypothetical protein C8J57DRAFT_1579878 [Mycena rebaudengoi]
MRGNKFYEFQLLYLAVVCTIGLLADHSDSCEERAEGGRLSGAGSAGALATLTRQYLLVYAIVMAQASCRAPTCTRSTAVFPERTITVLFVTGFVSAWLFAPLVGVWADQHSRRRRCLVFCAAYAGAGVCTRGPFLPIPLLSRVLGGASSAGLVETGAGVLSNQLVGFSRSSATPFVASGALIVLAWIVIGGTWGGNYDSTINSGDGGGGSGADPFQIARLRTAVRIVREGPRLLVLGLTQTCFEGSMYLFVFLRVPALQELSILGLLPLGSIFSAFMISICCSARSSTRSPRRMSQMPRCSHTRRSAGACVCGLVCHALPLGYIFSAFMLSMMLGSLFYTVAAAYATDASLLAYAELSGGRVRGLCHAAGRARHAARLPHHEQAPSALLLNVFLVVSLLTGVAAACGATLSASALMLAFASVKTGVVVVDGRRGTGDGGRGTGDGGRGYGGTGGGRYEDARMCELLRSRSPLTA